MTVYNLQRFHQIPLFQPGKLTVLNNMTRLPAEIAKFYKFFATNTTDIKEPMWTLPYEDGLGLSK